MSVFTPSDILLPDFKQVDPTRWACIACDQFTSEPDYWEEMATFVGTSPSTLHMILPEVFLGKDDEKRTKIIHQAMQDYQKNLLEKYPDALIYVERTFPDGRCRHGLVGAIDLVSYDYKSNATSPVRATEGTVLSRIPPRVAVRRKAPLESPHVMLLLDDGEDTVFSLLENNTVICPSGEDNNQANSENDTTAIDKANSETDTMTNTRTNLGEILYDFDLAQGGGHVRGTLLNADSKTRVLDTLAILEKNAPLPYAVGDGNHSLASAKAFFEEMREKHGEDILHHPCRYALCELVNIHDKSLEFEPIYRIVTGVRTETLLSALDTFIKKEAKDLPLTQSVTFVAKGRRGVLNLPALHTLTVGSLQICLDALAKENPCIDIDYIHGENTLCSLSDTDNTTGFLFDGIQKDDLFPAVCKDGALPRKTFSMGEAIEKKYYIECRCIEEQV